MHILRYKTLHKSLGVFVCIKPVKGFFLLPGCFCVTSSSIFIFIILLLACLSEKLFSFFFRYFTQNYLFDKICYVNKLIIIESVYLTPDHEI